MSQPPGSFPGPYGPPPPQPPQPPGQGGPGGPWPAGPYGPHPTQPPPPPPGWGGWPPAGPPPRQGLGAGAITAIVAGGVVVLALAGLGLVGALSTGGGGTMKLTTPQTLAGGRYELLPADQQPEQDKQRLQDELPADGTAVLATYALGGDLTTGGLVLSGAYGAIDARPEEMRADMLAGAAQEPGVTVVQRPRDFQPEGTGGPVISCELIKVTNPTGSLYSPVCAWADSSTMASVFAFSASTVSANEVDLTEFAGTTAQIKGEATTSRK